MLFYFVRHGETEANVKEILAGSGQDHALTEAGHRQAERLAEAIDRLIPHPIHRLVVSEMTRARQTAEYLAARLNLPTDVVADLREWHLGEWEGCTYSEYAHLLLGEGEPQKGESRARFYGRVESAWKSIHRDHEPYILVSHGAVWLALQDLLKIPRFKINNCDLVKIENREGGWRAEILKL